MVQKEVAEKLETNANKKSFLRWIVNYFYNVKIVKNVSLFVQEEFMMWKMAGLLSNIHIVV